MSQQITFIQNHLPLLESGNYSIDVSQQVIGPSTTLATYTSSQEFSVAGKRFRLDDSDVNSVYPPLGTSGQYDHSLPHIVLNSSSLPWQRSTGIGPYPNGNQAPWLALLLFDESEPIGAPVQMPLSEIHDSNQVFFPALEAEPGEDPDTPVHVIDVPLTLFVQIVPARDDLQWLAHVRRVAVSKKATHNHKAATDTYAVVIGNRLPQAGKVSTMHLVSLENYGAYLPDYTRTVGTSIPAGYSAVRLVTLHSWSFRTEAEAQGFTASLMNADMTPPTLQMPFAAQSGSDASANQSVQNAFGMGYTAMNHQLRNGDRTVSWYRGPLLPLQTPDFFSPSYSNADPLMRFDPTIGMFDATYASAWQLGKLMALRDNGYAQTLVRWKTQQTDEVVQQLEDSIIDQTFNLQQEGQQTSSAKRQVRFTTAVKNVAGPAAENMNASNTQE